MEAPCVDIDVVSCVIFTCLIHSAAQWLSYKCCNLWTENYVLPLTKKLFSFCYFGREPKPF